MYYSNQINDRFVYKLWVLMDLLDARGSRLNGVDVYGLMEEIRPNGEDG